MNAINNSNVVLATPTTPSRSGSASLENTVCEMVLPQDGFSSSTIGTQPQLIPAPAPNIHSPVSAPAPTNEPNSQTLPSSPQLRSTTSSSSEIEVPATSGREQSPSPNSVNLGNAIGNIIDVAVHSHADGCDKVVDVATAAAEEFGLSASAGIVGGALGYGLIGVGTAAFGGHEIAQGIKEGDAEKVIDGGGQVAGAISNGLASAAVATSASKGALAAIGQVARPLIAPFGVISGAVDAGLGVKEFADGVKTHSKHKIASGLLNTAFGSAMAASAVGGGLPALVIAGVCWAGQFGVNLHAKHVAKKAAEAEAQALAQANQQLAPTEGLNQQQEPSSV